MATQSDPNQQPPTEPPISTSATPFSDPLPPSAKASNESSARARAKETSPRILLRSLVYKSLSQTDHTMSHLNRLLATPSHTDTLLMTTSYSLSLLHAFLTSALQRRLNAETSTLINKLRSTPLLPGESLVATISPSPHSLIYRLQTSSKALARLIDDFRMFARLLALVKMWAWAAATIRNPAKDTLLKSIAWTQVVSCTVFQALENAAYLATKGVVEVRGEKVMAWYRWSARFWAVHVAMEFVRLWRVRQLEGEEEKRDEKVQAKWWRDLYVNAAWFPMTWHYSIAGGLISETSVAGLGFVAGVFGLREAWRVTA